MELKAFSNRTFFKWTISRVCECGYVDIDSVQNARRAKIANFTEIGRICHTLEK